MSSKKQPHAGLPPDSPSDVRPLPPRPNLEFEHKRAKELLEQLKHHDPDAIARVRNHKRDSSGEFKLSDAQFTLAREYGFASWPRLVEYFEALHRQELSGVRSGGLTKKDHEQFAERLVADHRSRRPSALFFASFVPRLFGRTLAEVLAADVTLDEARLVHARTNRYPSWDALMQGEPGEGEPPRNEWSRSDTPDYRAGRAIRSGDVEALGRLIDENPELMKKAPRVGHMVPINVLHSALHIELETRTPAARAMTDYIVSRGGDLRETASAMLARPFPLRQPGGDGIEYLLNRGADPEWLPPNGIPVIELAICRYWNGAAVDAIARRVKPRQAFWIAAGLGDVEAVKRYVGPDGIPTAAARQNRPDFTALSIFPLPSVPVADDATIVWEGFWIAAMNQRFAVLDVLLDRGFPIDYAAWGHSMLNLAVMNTWVPLVEYLVRRGASVDVRGWHPDSTAREIAENAFASRPTSEVRRVLELCGGRDPEIISREAAEERAKLTRPSSIFLEALKGARQDALHQGKAAAGLENLFVGLLRTENQLAVIYLSVGGVNLTRMKDLLGKRLDPSDEAVDDIPFDDWASQACMDAQEEAKRRLRTQINPLHLLYVLLKPDDGPVADMIKAAGGTLHKVREPLERDAI